MKDAIKIILSDAEAKQGMHIRTIADKLIMLGESGGKSSDEIFSTVQSLLSRDAKSKNSIFCKVKNAKGGFKRGVYKLKTISRTLPPVGAPKVNAQADTESQMPVISAAQNLYTGKAGECAVMSELLFRGYNVNTMLVDDGVDVVASKNNLFYFVQVKTTLVKDGKIYASIKQNRFDAFIGTQIRYVIVARCNISGIDSNMFFIFNNTDIQKFIFSDTVLSSGEDIRIKIRIDVTTGVPYLYHTKEEDVSFYLNRFAL
ncbi:MAG: hypothetical protein RR037_03340 [Alistipes sp.]